MPYTVKPSQCCVYCSTNVRLYIICMYTTDVYPLLWSGATKHACMVAKHTLSVQKYD